jgi:hypothetical protein
MNDDDIYLEYKKALPSQLHGYLRGLANHNDYPQLEHIKYLLTSSELKSHANVHVGNDSLFKGMLINVYDDIALKVIKYLIFDYKIDKTPAIEKALNNNESKIAEKVRKMFEMRDLHSDLSIELTNEKVSSKKIKL